MERDEVMFGVQGKFEGVPLEQAHVRTSLFATMCSVYQRQIGLEARDLLFCLPTCLIACDGMPHRARFSPPKYHFWPRSMPKFKITARRAPTSPGVS